MNASLQRMWIRLTSDRRRFGILVGVVLVGLLLWARIIIISKPPRRAVADEPAVVLGPGPEAARVGATDNPPLKPDVVLLAVAPRSDPFRTSPKYFPKPIHIDEPGEEVVELLPHTTDDETREARRTVLLQETAEQLTLGAVMKGGPAVINGRTIMLGESFAAGPNKQIKFTLIEIGTRSVIVEAEGRRFELRMVSYGGNE